jgi:ParB family chromosome partitioning protein
MKTDYKPALIAVDRLRPHPDNIREAPGDVSGVADSISSSGLLEPLVVQPNPARDGHFLILAGERRWVAAQAVGETVVPCVIREPQDRRGAVVIMLIENGHRRGLNPMEVARGLGILRAEGMTPAQITAATGYRPGSVSRYLALLELSIDTQERVRRRDVTVADALAGVRLMRDSQRRRKGQRPRSGAVIREADHFTARHPLAAAAQALCTAADHRSRRKLGKVACGQCWEAAIRADAGQTAAAAQPAAALSRPPAAVA